MLAKAALHAKPALLAEPALLPKAATLAETALLAKAAQLAKATAIVKRAVCREIPDQQIFAARAYDMPVFVSLEFLKIRSCISFHLHALLFCATLSVDTSSAALCSFPLLARLFFCRFSAYHRPYHPRRPPKHGKPHRRACKDPVKPGIAVWFYPAFHCFSCSFLVSCSWCSSTALS